ncbi:hypothetical protein [Mucilaginibacter flavus]|uniref:hypothetical protein n=1 Tax=Mucilaginibacter flavus TaxID=931504 RepID=UPI0025B56FE0|nr:hypothetical protein [Mucilaginibacter flavus]MDN3584501.1 hypothetical protein [Mucilaginibacter flavus]
MSLKQLTLLLLIILSTKTFGQTKQQDLRLSILRKNIVGHDFVFKTEENTTTHLKYLGILRSKKGDIYKVMNSIWLWGQAHRATSRILIFNGNNQYLGNYYLAVTDDLPSFIKDNELVFINDAKDNDCDLKSITRINFNNGLPNKFFRKCRGDSGDFYSFDSE